LEFNYFNPDPNRPPYQDDFGFGRTAREAFGHDLKNKLIEKSLRHPFQEGESSSWERRAHKALGLSRKDAFMVIARVRLLDGQPRAIHRAYLNPAHFPSSLRRDHNFENESLIRVYNESGYSIDRRDTILRAGYPTEEDRIVLEIDRIPVLEAEQELHATHVESGVRRIIEYLRVCYVAWEYKISSRSGVDSEPRQTHSRTTT